jgi:type IV fimbrial biogenesis protein FimT
MKMTTKRRDVRGFSLIELMVTLALGAILLGLGLPAFNGLIEQRTMTTEVNDVVLAVHYARSEAVKLGGVVTIQLQDAGDNDNEWGPGYCVVVGDPGDCDDALRVFSVSDDVTLNAVGLLNGRDSISFDSRGLSSLNGISTLELCSTDENTDPGRIVEINNIGRTSARELVCNP